MFFLNVNMETVWNMLWTHFSCEGYNHVKEIIILLFLPAIGEVAALIITKQVFFFFLFSKTLKVCYFVL